MLLNESVRLGAMRPVPMQLRAAVAPALVAVLAGQAQRVRGGWA